MVVVSMLTEDLFCSYHMQYAHGTSHPFPSSNVLADGRMWIGISPAGTPFSPPTAFTRVARPNATKHEKTSVEQGRCHRCRKWVAVEGIKDVEVKVCFISSFLYP